MDFNALLLHLIALSQTTPPETLDGWYSQTLQAWVLNTDSGARALQAGVLADGLGHAFAGGYSAALQRLLATSSPRLTALCVTEAGGNQPRHIETTLTRHPAGWRLNGEKSFVTLADRAEWLWVAACTGESEGRKQLKMVGLPAVHPGVTLIALPTMKFVPEIGHAKVRFNDVPIDETAILSGDGYSDYVKPFRTLEDIHVSAASCGFLLGQALRQQWPAEHLEGLISLAHSWLTLAKANAQLPATHLSLAGLMRLQLQLIDSVTPQLTASPSTRERWQRDLPLLKVAEKARQQRTANAWHQMWPDFAPPSPPSTASAGYLA